MKTTCIFVGIPAGDITWETLLGGSVGAALGIPLAFGAAWFAFWLQSRHGARQGLVDAVESLRELTVRVASSPDRPVDTGRQMTSAEAQLFAELNERAQRVRERCGRRDKLLSKEVEVAWIVAYGADITNERYKATAVWQFLNAWLDRDRRSKVRNGSITVDSTLADLKAAMTEYGSKLESAIMRPPSHQPGYGTGP